MKKAEKYINYIETVLTNRNVDSEDSDWKQNSELHMLINSSEKIYITDSLSFGMDSPELILMVKVLPATIDAEFIETVKAEILKKIKEIYKSIKANNQQDIFKFINILFFVQSIEVRINLKESFSSKNVRTLMSDIKNETCVKRLKLNPVFYLDKDVILEEIKIPNIKRYEMVTLPPFDIDIGIPKEEKNNTLKGYVFTANLFDIVSLYNTIGDQLFKKNVRLGIDDKLDVDKSIQETLRDKPEAFWFRNNGITILVEEPKMKLDRVGEIVLKEAYKSHLGFSVINGAQTITAAAEYYYLPENKDKIKDFSIAKVIVKIIHIQNENSKETEKEAKNISVSLNRQKPIKAEDIAFTNEFVEIMNDYLDCSEFNFTLIRRGEEYTSGNRAYSLINFAKARKACSGDPGPARSNATAKFLKISPEKSQFHDHSIFIPEWYTSSDDERNRLFKKYYSPILFTMDMAEKCQALSKSSKLSGAPGNVIKNGMWYFISYVVYLLNNGDDKDYSDFTYTTDKISTDNLKYLFEEFAKFYCKELNATEADTISNIFKTSEKYKALKEVNYINSSFYDNICTLFEKKKTTESKTKKDTGIHVHFNGVNINVKNTSDAFIYTIQQCLNNTSKGNISKAISELSFLTSDPSINSGFFARKEAIMVQGKTIYLGKHSDNNLKIKHLTKLCNLISISPNTISWENENSIIFEY